MALRGAVARKARYEGRRRARALEPETAESFRADLLTSLRGQVQRIGRLIAKEQDGKKLAALADAQAKLAAQVRDLGEPRTVQPRKAAGAPAAPGSDRNVSD